MRQIVAIGVVGSLLWMLSCAVRERRPDGPYREAEEFADALSDHVVECTSEHARGGPGQVVIAAEMSRPAAAPTIHDLGSSPGNEPVIACVEQRAAETLRSPKTTPAPFVRIRVPVPVVTSDVSYAFMPELPKRP